MSTAAKRADEAIAALTKHGGFAVESVAPAALPERVRQAVEGGASRIVVAGGDGSISAAAGAVCGTACELAVLPAGTLNHLARDLGLPADLEEAVCVAAGTTIRAIDVGRVNGRVFLNTSSVGAYVTFVRTRDRLERRLGYRLASALAAARILLRLHSVRVTLVVDGRRREYHTPLVFIGIGERELKAPTLGARIPDGRGGFHVMVIRTNSGARTLALGLAAAARGLEAVARNPAMDSFIVDALAIAPQRRIASARIALDGETVTVVTPLEYVLERGALSVVVASDRPAEPPER